MMSVLLGTPRFAVALSCEELDEPLETTIARAYAQVDIVAVGRATAAQGSKAQRFTAKRVWKGVVPEEIRISRFDAYSTNEDQAIFARGPHKDGYYLGAECLHFADLSSVVEILKARYGAGWRPEPSRRRSGMFWYTLVLILALIGLGVGISAGAGIRI